jgi:hypothetical protein
MGLDMYAYTLDAEAVKDSQVDIQLQAILDRGIEVNRDFAYWRNFYELHTWMEDLYRRKGGSEEDFNVVTVRLTLEDLDELERACENHDFPSARSNDTYFLESKIVSLEDLDELERACENHDFPSPCSIVSTLEFISRARKAIHEGKAVLYDSWW